MRNQLLPRRLTLVGFPAATAADTPASATTPDCTTAGPATTPPATARPARPNAPRRSRPEPDTIRNAITKPILSHTQTHRDTTHTPASQHTKPRTRQEKQEQKKPGGHATGRHQRGPHPGANHIQQPAARTIPSPAPHQPAHPATSHPTRQPAPHTEPGTTTPSPPPFPGRATRPRAPDHHPDATRGRPGRPTGWATTLGQPPSPTSHRTPRHGTTVTRKTPTPDETTHHPPTDPPHPGHQPDRRIHKHATKPHPAVPPATGPISVGALLASWPTSALCGVVALGTLVGYAPVAVGWHRARVRWTLTAGMALSGRRVAGSLSGRVRGGGRPPRPWLPRPGRQRRPAHLAPRPLAQPADTTPIRRRRRRDAGLGGPHGSLPRRAGGGRRDGSPAPRAATTASAVRRSDTLAPRRSPPPWPREPPDRPEVAQQRLAADPRRGRESGPGRRRSSAGIAAVGAT